MQALYALAPRPNYLKQQRMKNHLDSAEAGRRKTPVGYILRHSAGGPLQGGCWRATSKAVSTISSHDWLIDHIPMDKSVLKARFLKADLYSKASCFLLTKGRPKAVSFPDTRKYGTGRYAKGLSDRFHTNRLGKIDLRFKERPQGQSGALC